MRSSRRRFLIAAAVLGSAVGSGCGGAPAPPRYRWRKGAMDGGGYCNAMAADPHGAGNAAAAGDIWGEYATANGGAFWYPTMTGATAVDEIYGRAVVYSQLHPGLRYSGIGLLPVDHDRSRGIEYLYALSRQGLVRSSDGGRSLVRLGLPAPLPQAAWSA